MPVAALRITADRAGLVDMRPLTSFWHEAGCHYAVLSET